MTVRRFVKSVAWGFIAAQIALNAQSAHAYTLFDWMRGWPGYYGPSATVPAIPAAAPPAAPAPALPPPTAASVAPPSIYTPPTATAPPAAVATAPPSLVTPPPASAQPAPVLSSAPGCGAAPTCGTAPTCSSRPGCADRPATAYQPPQPRKHGCCLFNWWKTPTYYKPVVQYRTQLMRVPTTNYQPTPATDPVTGVPTTVMKPCTTYTWQFQRVPHLTYRPMYDSSPSTNYSYRIPYAPTTYNAVPAWPTPPVPSYTPPAYTTVPAPSGAATSGAFQGMPLPPTGGNASTGASPSPSPTPADQVPSLNPAEAQGLQKVPTSKSFKIPLSDPQVAPTPAQKQEASNAGQSDKLPVVPLPDPEADEDDMDVDAIPSLYDPSDRTAARTSYQPQWAVAPIVWAKPPATEAAALAPQPKQTKETPARAADSGIDGWTVVRP